MRTMTTANCYVYVYEVDGVVRYVGRGRGTRISAHFKEAARRAANPQKTTKQRRFYDRLVRAIADGSTIVSRKVADKLSGDEAGAREIEEIACYPRGQLWNSIFSYHPVILDEELSARYSAAQKALWANPEERAKRLAAQKEAMARPGIKEKQKAATRAALAVPGVEEKRLARLRAAAANPEMQARRGAAIKAAYENPDVKARHLAALIAGMHRPGVIEQRVATWRMTTATPEYKQRKSLISAEVQGRPEARKLRSDKATAQWLDPEKRANNLAAQARARALKGG